MTLADARVDLAAQLAAVLNPAGWAVALDPRNVNPPCVLIGAPTGITRAACGMSGQVDVVCIAAGPGNLDALDVLLAMVELVAPVVEVVGTIEPTTHYPDPAGDTGLPAYAVPALLNST